MTFSNNKYDSMHKIVNNFNLYFTTVEDRYITTNTFFQADKLINFVQVNIPLE